MYNLYMYNLYNNMYMYIYIYIHCIIYFKSCYINLKIKCYINLKLKFKNKTYCTV